jgi:hypothetical protein
MVPIIDCNEIRENREFDTRNIRDGQGVRLVNDEYRKHDFSVLKKTSLRKLLQIFFSTDFYVVRFCMVRRGQRFSNAVWMES